mmetsp:Transcript_11759/g.37698  ORF Transcript_11759/g.37698 Transcript_11759/m.37698 type:complete len:230 (+) Transcript_11759:200-889(+)
MASAEWRAMLAEGRGAALLSEAAQRALAGESTSPTQSHTALPLAAQLRRTMPEGEIKLQLVMARRAPGTPQLLAPGARLALQRAELDSPTTLEEGPQADSPSSLNAEDGRDGSNRPASHAAREDWEAAWKSGAFRDSAWADWASRISSAGQGCADAFLSCGLRQLDAVATSAPDDRERERAIRAAADRSELFQRDFANFAAGVAALALSDKPELEHLIARVYHERRLPS